MPRPPHGVANWSSAHEHQSPLCSLRFHHGSVLSYLSVIYGLHFRTHSPGTSGKSCCFPSWSRSSHSTLTPKHKHPAQARGNPGPLPPWALPSRAALTGQDLASGPRTSSEFRSRRAEGTVYAGTTRAKRQTSWYQIFPPLLHHTLKNNLNQLLKPWSRL